MTTLSRRGLMIGAAATLAAPSIVRAASSITLKVYSNQAANDASVHYLWFQQFETKLKDAVGDQIKLNFFPNGILGKENDATLQVKLGSIDMMIMNSGVWAPLCPEISVFDLCYLFDSEAHQAKAMDGAAGAAASKLLFDRTGVTTLAWTYHLSPRNIYSKQPIASIDGIKSMKLRVFQTKAFIEAFEKLGAVPTPVPFNELYTAVQTGVVDGFELDNGSTRNSKMYEVTKNCFESQHLFMALCAYIGKVGLAKIPATIRPAFLKAAEDATKAHRQEVQAKEAEVKDLLQKAGVTFTPMKAEEHEATRKLMASSVWKPFVDQYPTTKPIVDAIQNSRS